MNRPFAACVLLTAAGLSLGCGRKSSQTAELQECSSIALDARGTADCLVRLHGWEPAAAQLAAVARHRELDSLKRHQDDSLWNLSATDHRRQLATCRGGADPLQGCLLMSGWPLSRVRAVVESLWQAEAPMHRRELEACQRRRDVALPSCLTLYYKWESDRAIRTADSLTRLRLGGQTSR